MDYWIWAHKRSKKGQVITQLEADNFLLKEDLISFEKGVTNLIKKQYKPKSILYLVSFAFNLKQLNLKNSTLLKKVNANPNDRTIVDEFIKYGLCRRKTIRRIKKETTSRSISLF